MVLLCSDEVRSLPLVHCKPLRTEAAVEASKGSALCAYGWMVGRTW